MVADRCGRSAGDTGGRAIYRELDEHRGYLADGLRLDAYRRALAEVVTADSVVLDLGAGTGVLGLLAARAGAARVHAVDRGAIIAVARAIAAANGIEDVEHWRAPSTEVELPEPATVVVCDQLDPTGVRAGLLESLADARARLLADGAVAMPSELVVHVAPIEHAAARAAVAFWRTRPAGLDCTPAAELVEHQLGWDRFGAEHLLGPAMGSEPVDTLTHGPAPVAVTGTSTVARDGVLHGLGVWFDARLSPTVVLTSRPGAADAVDRDHGYLPLPDPVPVRAGAVVGVDVSVGQVVTWRVTVDGEAVGGVHSTMAGELLDGTDLERNRGDRVPSLGLRGAALLRVADAVAAGTDVEGLRALAATELADVAGRHGGPTAFVDWALSTLER